MKNRALLAAAFSLVLAACGGGGSNDSPAPSTPSATGPTSQELADAQAAKLTAKLQVGTNMATLSWADTFEPGTSYAIEQQGQDGTWTSVDAVPGTTGTGSSLTWSRTINVTTSLRVSAQKGGYEVPLGTASGTNSVEVTVPTSTPTIVLDQVPPISGTVNASIAGGTTYSSVTYYLDLNLAGTATAGPGYSAALDTSGLTATSHLIIARLATGPDTYEELRLQVQLANPEIAVEVHVVGGGGLPLLSGSGQGWVSVGATSAYPITSVTASMDGNTLGTLTATNGCEALNCGGILDHYQFPIDTTVIGSGTHTITAEATDANGATASRVTTVTFTNPPSISLTSPFDGALVNGTLQIAGTFKTDRASTTVSLSVTLGSLPVVNTSTSPFSASFNLAGVPPGSYTLTATATDSKGLWTTVTDTVTVTSSPNLVYQPILTLGEQDRRLLAVNGTDFLYSNSAQRSVHLVSGSADTPLPLGAIQNPSAWTLADGSHVFVEDLGNRNVYMWPPGGAAQNLSSAAGSTGGDNLLAVHYPWVLWVSDFPGQNGNAYILYNVSTAQKLTIPSPPNMSLGNTNVDFFVAANGRIELFYWQDNSSTSGTSSYNVLQWDQATGTSTALTSDGKSTYPQTDGTSVAWQTSIGSTSWPATAKLTTMDLASATTRVLSTNMATFQLSNGLLGWMDQTYSDGLTVTTQAINAWDGTSTIPVSTQLKTVFHGSSGGYIFFEEGGKLYAWSPSGGRQLLFDAAPGGVVTSGKTIYFSNGANQVAYYRVTLP